MLKKGTVVVAGKTIPVHQYNVLVTASEHYENNAPESVLRLVERLEFVRENPANPRKLLDEAILRCKAEMAQMAVVLPYLRWNHGRRSAVADRAAAWMVAGQTLLAAAERISSGLPVEMTFRTGKSGHWSAERWVNVTVFGVSVGTGNSMNAPYLRIQ